jgi:hypothetical protein
MTDDTRFAFPYNILEMDPEAENVSWPEVGAGLRITVLHEPCDTWVDFTFSVEKYPEQPWQILHHGTTDQPCPECGDDVFLRPCGEIGHAWREFPTVYRGPIVICLVCGERPHVPIRPEMKAACA